MHLIKHFLHFFVLLYICFKSETIIHKYMLALQRKLETKCCRMQLHDLLLDVQTRQVVYYLATFIAYAGTFGALITLFECHYFAGPEPDLSFGNFKRSMISHSTMMVGCLYLFVGGYVKIRVSNLIPYCVGLVGCLVLGIAVNGLFAAFGLPSPNAMYLVETRLAEQYIV